MTIVGWLVDAGAFACGRDLAGRLWRGGSGMACIATERPRSCARDISDRIDHVCTVVMRREPTRMAENYSRHVVSALWNQAGRCTPSCQLLAAVAYCRVADVSAERVCYRSS